MEDNSQLELIEIDAYNLMLHYLSKRIDLHEFKNELENLLKGQTPHKEEIIKKLKVSARYEAFLMFHGRTDQEREQIKKEY